MKKVIAVCSFIPCQVLQKALGLIHDKAERKRREGSDKEKFERERREAIAAQMEDDKKWRQVKAENLAQALAAQEIEMREKEAIPPPSISVQESADASAAAALQRLLNGDGAKEKETLTGDAKTADDSRVDPAS